MAIAYIWCFYSGWIKPLTLARDVMDAFLSTFRAVARPLLHLNLLRVVAVK
jgi:hypothetical protein